MKINDVDKDTSDEQVNPDKQSVIGNSDKIVDYSADNKQEGSAEYEILKSSDTVENNDKAVSQNVDSERGNTVSGAEKVDKVDNDTNTDLQSLVKDTGLSKQPLGDSQLSKIEVAKRSDEEASKTQDSVENVDDYEYSQLDRAADNREMEKIKRDAKYYSESLGIDQYLNKNPPVDYIVDYDAAVKNTDREMVTAISRKFLESTKFGTENLQIVCDYVYEHSKDLDKYYDYTIALGDEIGDKNNPELLPQYLASKISSEVIKISIRERLQRYLNKFKNDDEKVEHLNNMKLADFMELSEGYTKSEKKLLNQAFRTIKVEKKIEFLEREVERGKGKFTPLGYEFEKNMDSFGSKLLNVYNLVYTGNSTEDDRRGVMMGIARENVNKKKFNMMTPIQQKIATCAGVLGNMAFEVSVFAALGGTPKLLKAVEYGRFGIDMGDSASKARFEAYIANADKCKSRVMVINALGNSVVMKFSTKFFNKAVLGGFDPTIQKGISSMFKQGLERIYMGKKEQGSGYKSGESRTYSSDDILHLDDFGSVSSMFTKDGYKNLEKTLPEINEKSKLYLRMYIMNKRYDELPENVQIIREFENISEYAKRSIIPFREVSDEYVDQIAMADPDSLTKAGRDVKRFVNVMKEYRERFPENSGKEIDWMIMSDGYAYTNKEDIMFLRNNLEFMMPTDKRMSATRSTLEENRKLDGEYESKIEEYTQDPEGFKKRNNFNNWVDESGMNDVTKKVREKYYLFIMYDSSLDKYTGEAQRELIGEVVRLLEKGLTKDDPEMNELLTHVGEIYSDVEDIKRINKIVAFLELYDELEEIIESSKDRQSVDLNRVLDDKDIDKDSRKKNILFYKIKQLPVKEEEVEQESLLDGFNSYVKNTEDWITDSIVESANLWN